MTDNPDRELVTRLRLESLGAIDRIKEFRAEIEAAKEVVRELSAGSQESLNVIEQAMKRVVEQAKKYKDETGKLTPTGEAVALGPGGMQQIEEVTKLAEVIKGPLGTAIKEVRAEYSAFTKEAAQQTKLISDAERQAAVITKQTEAEKTAAARQSAQERLNQIRQLIILQQEEEAAARKGFGSSTQAAQQYKDNLAQIKIELENLKKQGFSLDEAAQGLIRSGQFAATDVNAAVSSMSTGFMNLGNVARVVFGIGGPIFIAAQIVRNLTQYMGEAVVAGEEFTKSIFKLQLGINSLRREGVDITFAEINDQIQELSNEFGFLSETSIVSAISSVAFLTRELGLSKDQMLLVTKSALALSSVLGKDASESARQIAMAISSGYSEALQKAGLNINRVTIAQRAFSLGLTESRRDITSLTEEVKAQAVLSLIDEQMRDLFPDLIMYLETTAGKIEEANSSFTDLKTTIGVRTLPVVAAFKSALGFLAEQATNLVNLIAILAVEVYRDFQTMGFAIDRFNEILKSGQIFDREAWEQARQDINEYFKTVELEAAKAVFPKEFGLIPEAPLGEPDTKDIENKILDAFSRLKETIETEQLKLNQRLVDLEIDLMRDLEKIDRDGLDKREKLWTDFQNRLDSINRSYNDDVAKEIRKYNDDRAEIYNDTNDKIKDAQDDFRNDEINEEAKFQEKLRQLRENFLYDLEEAVRARDASQMRTLIRQFNLRREQMIRERELEKNERKRDLDDQIQEINDDRARRLAELQRDHQYRLRELQIQRDIEKREADIKYRQELEALQKSLVDQRAERFIKYGEQIEDARRAMDDRLQIVATGLATELKLTEEMAKRIYDTLLGYFGPGGAVEKIYQYFFETIAAMRKAAQEAWPFGNIFEGAPGGTPENSTPVTPPGMAEGGTIIARDPTVAIFGERGAEMAQFTPLNRVGSNVGSVFGSNIPSGLNGNGKQKITLEVLLSPELLVGMTDQISDSLAELIVGVTKGRR